MRLQSDPTVAYGIAGGEGLGRALTRADLQAPTPYNTYTIAGLPPGPICNPGLASLQAVLQPAETDYLYFRSDEHTSELQSLMRISYAVFCLKKKKNTNTSK